MKKVVNLIILIFVFSFFVNVKADMGPPSVIKYYVTVVNKDGAACYDYTEKGYVKGAKTVPYGKEYYVVDEVENNKYVYIYSDDDNQSCLVSLSDIMIKNGNFDIKSEEVVKIDESKAIIFAKGGLNLRKGPAMSYSKIITVPQYSVVKVKYRAGTYWYYAEYSGKEGWISAINGYFGYDSSDVLYDINDVKIYNADNKVIGTIPKYTEITDYVKFPVPERFQYNYFVNYKGGKGYVIEMSNKIDGELKLLNDAYIYSGNKVIDKAKSGDTVKFTVMKPGKNISADNPYLTDYIFYVPSLKGTMNLRNDDKKKEYTIIKDDNVKKMSGYIGEGLFGEIKEEKEIKEEIEEKVENNSVDNSKNNNNMTEIIIICVLSSIIGALTCFIVIKLVNNKKKEEIGGIDEKE